MINLLFIMKPFKSTLTKMYRPSKYKRPVYKNTNPRRQRGENYVRYRLRLSIKRNLFLKIRTKNYSNLLEPKYLKIHYTAIYNLLKINTMRFMII